MLPVANEKQQGVSFNIRLQHVSVIIDHVHRKLTKLRHTIVLYMLVNVTCNHSWRTLSWRRNASKEIIKKLHRQEVFLCAAHQSPLKQKKFKKRINLVHFRNVEEEFPSRNQMTTFHSTRQHFAFCHADSRTDGPEVTVINTRQNLKSNAFRLGLKYFLKYRAR